MRPHGEEAADLRIAWAAMQIARYLARKGSLELRDFIAPGSGLLPDEKDGGSSTSGGGGGQTWKQQKALVTAAIGMADHQARLRKRRLDRARKGPRKKTRD